ncbi:polyamine aminopropyltransferase [Candidatus Dependentiae bacterium]|nr:polyamine aminopropyltransferase [Candidatus Dependentiae bacterium]MBU4387680.1 polyamine aminopropyltransferase [Candidatus Dependentiae bacterium]
MIIKENNINYFFENTCPTDESILKHGIGIKKILFSGIEKIKLNNLEINMKVEIFDTYAYGKMLTLDDRVQTSEFDEFIYHEIITHVPMLYHKNPKNILIIGGGDGGSLREVLKHDIESVSMVEISKSVIESCKKYIPSIPNNCYENPKSNLIIGDGRAFIQKNKNKFDVIILDLSDPDGPADGLTSKAFYQEVYDALKSDGIVSIQSESLTYQHKLVSSMQKNIRAVFPFAQLHTASIPTYQGSTFGFTVAAKHDFTQLTKEYVKSSLNKLGKLKYLDENIFFASTIIPSYLKEKIDL